MNLQVLVGAAEIVSALAVTFTLIALIISIRQNTRSQKALVELGNLNDLFDYVQHHA
jgi:hypothetical protein